MFEGRVHDTVTHETVRQSESIIEFANISGAGILHNQRSPAILAVYKCPLLTNVNISKSASNGITMISPQDTVSLLFNWLVYENIRLKLGSIVESSTTLNCENYYNESFQTTQ